LPPLLERQSFTGLLRPEATVLEPLGFSRIWVWSSVCKSTQIQLLQHLDVRELWIQERVSRGDLSIRKVYGLGNLADILTKRVPRNVLDKHLENTRMFRRSGRHVLSPSL
jgi:hypothetical protein